ncbi:phenylacetic acid degradation protein [Acuticoccus sediminis]|uniref:Phenylacetic acid degradation protein n=1 Tax=Acuticoccus sediminis TaxID=2184697 RepID=A0A8B2NJM2_9HYPH|nr:PaaI family thioesterase [Acuticoccus sediminis]RAH97430.1 phenylacetic acid degradation protein [Acuticoccus sediminis]
MSEALDKGAVEALLRKGPFHEWLGLTVADVGEGTIEIHARWRPEWVVNTAGGYVHGGILATLVDLTADWALVSKTGKGVPTIDMRVDYHAPAMEGDLKAVGKVVKLGRTFSVCEAQVFNMDGKLLASGRGTYMMPQQK